jgi:hypothetical protein
MPFDGNFNLFLPAAPSLWQRLYAFCVPPAKPSVPSVSVPMQLMLLARDMIADHRRWTRGSYHDLGSKTLIRRCLVGALQSARKQIQASASDFDTAYDLLLTTAVAMRPNGMEGWSYLEGFNDVKGHAAVMGLLDTTIERFARDPAMPVTHMNWVRT